MINSKELPLGPISLLRHYALILLFGLGWLAHWIDAAPFLSDVGAGCVVLAFCWPFPRPKRQAALRICQRIVWPLSAALCVLYPYSVDFRVVLLLLLIPVVIWRSKIRPRFDFSFWFRISYAMIVALICASGADEHFSTPGEALVWVSFRGLFWNFLVEMYRLQERKIRRLSFKL